MPLRISFAFLSILFSLHILSAQPEEEDARKRQILYDRILGAVKKWEMGSRSGNGQDGVAEDATDVDDPAQDSGEQPLIDGDPESNSLSRLELERRIFPLASIEDLERMLRVARERNDQASVERIREQIRLKRLELLLEMDRRSAFF